MSFHEVIQTMIKQFGLSIFLDNTRFKAIFFDLAPKMEKEKKIIRRISEENRLSRFLDINNCKESDRKHRLVALFNELVNDVGLSEEWAREVVNEFAIAFGWNTKNIDILAKPVKTSNILVNNSPNNTGVKSSQNPTVKTNNNGNGENQQNKQSNYTKPTPKPSPTSSSTKDPKKKRLPVIQVFALILVCVAGVITVVIVALLSGRTPDNKGTNQDSGFQNLDVDFKGVLSQETTEDIHDIYIRDFDGNGKAEAFATTIDSNDGGYDNLWYVSEQGATLVDEAGMVPQLLVTESGEILVPWRARYGATLCYGLYHGQVKSLDIYKANIFQREEKGTIYAVEEYFTDNGEYHKNIACEFNGTAFELVLTNEFYESNPAEDTDFCWNRETPEAADYQESDFFPQDEITRTGDETFKESDLYQTAITSIPETIQEWCYEDFDGDGKKEAFVSTGDNDTYFTEHGEKSLWYLSDTGNVECIFDNEAYWYFSDTPFTFSDCKLFYVDARHGYYCLLGVKNDSPVEVGMPVDAYYYWISQNPESGIVTAADKMEERAHVLEFDSDTMEFIDTGKTVLNE